MKRAVFRADSSHQIGSGHVARCMVLGEALLNRGWEVGFVTRPHDGACVGLLRNSPFRVFELPKIDKRSSPSGNLRHRSWLGVPQELDLSQTISLLSESNWKNIDLCVVDHYGLDRLWESGISAIVRKTGVIDDLADRKHQADWLLNQNLPSANIDYSHLVPASTRLFLGPSYALLREEFRSHRARLNLPKHEKSDLQMLIFFGGSDPFGLTLRSLQFLEEGAAGVSPIIVAGGANAEILEISDICRHHNWPLQVQTAQMAGLLADSDLALGAGGVSVWERCCLGIPSATVTFSENQHSIAQSAHAAGLTIWIGNTESFTLETFRLALQALVGDPQLRSEMSRRCMNQVDGNGIFRLVKEIISFYEN